MGYRILIYGATGFSGGLIAAEAARLLANEWSGKGHEVMLAARNEAHLARLGASLGLPYRAFSLDSAIVIERSIRDFDVVLNAAGPFAFTAPALARACIFAGCHYVDICGEVEVYKALDDFGSSGRDRKVALVCGAGHCATLSDVLLRRALTFTKERELGSVHIAVSSFSDFSRGSAMVMMRAMREQVVLAAADTGADAPAGRRSLRLTHAPIDRIQELFDFGDREADGARVRQRIASAANLVDTLVAKRCLEECLVKHVGLLPDRVISFIEMDMPMRLAYQAGAWAAPFYGQSWARRLMRGPLSFLPDGPPAEDRRGHRRQVVLRIDDRFGDRLIDWRLETPDVYDVTARCVLEVAQAVPAKGLMGWQTPGHFVELVGEQADGASVRFSNLALTDCVLNVTRSA